MYSEVVAEHGRRRDPWIPLGCRPTRSGPSWILRLVNGKFKGHLVLCLSTCFGLSAAKMLANELVQGDLEETPPYGLLVANIREVPWSDAGVGYLVFYHHLRKGNGFQDAIMAMRAASDNSGFFGTIPDPSGVRPMGLVAGISKKEAEQMKRMIADA